MHAGEVMQGAVGEQCSQLEGMTNAVDHMHDDTRALTRMAGRMHRKVSGGAERMVGMFY